MGVIKINGVTYGGGDNSVMLTQAEYDALVEAGTVDPTVLYMITDKNSENTAYAATVSYANTDSGLSATNVQDAIDELAETGGGAGVSVLTYAEYQELVDAGEVNPDISYYISDSNTTGTNYAAGISYDNTESGMTATDVQEAIDELAPVKDDIGNIDNVSITSPSVGDTLTWNGTNWVNGGVKSVLLTGSITCSYADSGTIGYRSTTQTAVALNTLANYPTGKTILGFSVEYAYCGADGEIYKIALININSGIAWCNSLISGTVRFAIRCFYLN